MAYLINRQQKRIDAIPKGYEISRVLPKGNWLVKYEEDNEKYCLVETESFKLPKKIYGDLHKVSSKYLSVYRKGNKNLGVLLRGFKGTGKSLLAKMLCIKSNLPVLLISEPFLGAKFVEFLGSIKDECIIFIDEFEKLYKHSQEKDENSQESFLSIMDGSLESKKKLFILTANDGYIHPALLNRPGRIRYERNYEGLSDDLLNEIIEDQLEDKLKKEDILNVFSVLSKVNIDSVTSLIEEVNNFPEDDIYELAGEMNLFPESGSFVLTWEDGQSVSMGSSSPSSKIKSVTVEEHPLSSTFIYLDSGNTIAGESCIYINKCEVISVTDTVILRYKGVKMTFTPIQPYKFQFKKQ